jgi:hypothetical protein
MNLKFRYGIVFILLAGILLLAGIQAAGADVAPDDNGEQLLLQSDVSNSVNAGKPGTINPPPGEVVITESGTYNIGGFCNYTVEFLVPDISVHISLERPLPRPLPGKVHAVRQGCRVTYYQRPDGTRIDEFTAEMGTSQICFADIPKNKNTVYFLNIYSADPAWGPAKGIEDACSDAGLSGVYVGTFEKP